MGYMFKNIKLKDFKDFELCVLGMPMFLYNSDDGDDDDNDKGIKQLKCN